MTPRDTMAQDAGAALSAQDVADGWVAHDGRGRPVDKRARVIVRYRNGEVSRPSFASGRIWKWWARTGPAWEYDVAAYRVVQP